MTRFAEVAVDAPVHHSSTFSYSIPEGLRLEPGQLVWVPFGRRILQGMVMELTAAPQVAQTRDILQAVEPGGLLSDTALNLTRWLSDYYFCSRFDAAALFLPPGFKAQVRSQILPLPVSEPDRSGLNSSAKDALETLAGQKRMREADFAGLLGRAGMREVNRLVEKGLVHRRVDLPRPRSFSYASRLIPVGSPDAHGNWPETGVPVSPRQARLLQAARERDGGYSTTTANREFGHGVGDALVEKGLLAQEWVRREARPVANSASPDGSARDLPEPEPPFALTEAQERALAPIAAALADSKRQPRTFLLHGVTGSGKTEVYLQAIAQAMGRGRKAIFLVPEISLTSQTVQRVNARFPGRVAVIHSGLTDRQRFDQWWQIRNGDYDVVVGPRSALFAPLPDQGLIILDEEHEWTYKQVEGRPLYHARTAALELARLTGAAVALGSATPDVESYYHARSGHYQLLELPERIRTDALPTASRGSGAGDSPADVPATSDALARVEIVDMRQELRQGNRGIFSRALTQGLTDCLNSNRQAILFLNQRGSAPLVQCRDCGYVVTCSGCATSLTYHSSDAQLRCHRCNRRRRLPRVCPQCQGSHIRQLGIGTQRVVDEVQALFPDISVERWDSDAASSGLDPDETMAKLLSGQVQALVGTQMVAKGLDLPNVTFVGVVLADIGIWRPDFRAGERAFSLLCQVAGRAGRGSQPGRVVIQTYNPDHYAVAAAAGQDYAALFRQEIVTRRQQGNPPFNQLVRLLCQNSNQTGGQRQATNLARLIRERIRAQGLTDVSLIGPAPGIPQRVRGRYRWNLLLRGRNLQRFLREIDLPPRDVTIDVDPVELL